MRELEGDPIVADQLFNTFTDPEGLLDIYADTTPDPTQAEIAIGTRLAVKLNEIIASGLEDPISVRF